MVSDSGAVLRIIVLSINVRRMAFVSHVRLRRVSAQTNDLSLCVCVDASTSPKAGILSICDRQVTPKGHINFI